MPASHIVERIKSIEGRINEIQQIGNLPKKTEKTETSNNQEKFSDVLQEVMKSKTNADLSLLGIENTNNTTSSNNNLLENKFESLLSEYKKIGEMPTTVPKVIRAYSGDSTNPHTWDHIIKKASEKFDIDENLIHAVIQTESAYDPQAVSKVGAQGLMQLMPYTAKDLNVTNSFDPYENIMGGTQYLRQMFERYNGNLIKTLAAYNAGPEAVDKANGIPPYRETQDYVPKVLNHYYNLRDNK